MVFHFLDFSAISAYFENYGLLFFFILIFLEHLSLPGLPAGVVMPSMGFLVSQSGTHFGYALFLSVVAGMAGSTILYFIGYFLGKPLLSWIHRRQFKINSSLVKIEGYFGKYPSKAIFICRILPVIRTLVSFMGGTLKIDFLTFSIYSAMGILLWNAVTIYAGYAFGYLIFGF